MKLGFIGTGNMATAIVKGIVEKGVIKGEDIYLFDIMTDKVQQLAKEIGATACATSDDVIKESDATILSVKPNIISKVLQNTRDVILKKQPLIISIAAGTPISKIYNFLETRESVPVVRVMPNLNAMIYEGAAAVCGNEFVSEEQLDFVLGLFKTVGRAWKLEEKDFSNFTALSGSSPAYAYLFIDSLARAGVKHGLAKDLSTEIAAQAVLGSAKMVLESKESPWNLIDRVSSPGGTTVAGLLALEDEAFISTVVKGMDATIKKDQELNSL